MHESFFCLSFRSGEEEEEEIETYVTVSLFFRGSCYQHHIYLTADWVVWYFIVYVSGGGGGCCCCSSSRPILGGLAWWNKRWNLEYPKHKIHRNVCDVR